MESREKIKQIASIAWKGAANAFRMYPNNKHTFTDYWSAAESQFKDFIEKKQPKEPREEEYFGIENLTNLVFGEKLNLYQRGLAIHEFGKLKQKAKDNQGDRECIDFAQWIGDKLRKDSWFRYEGNFKTWYIHLVGNVTSDQLYQIFLKELPSPPKDQREGR